MVPWCNISSDNLFVHHFPVWKCRKIMLFWSRVHPSLFSFMSGGLCMNFGGGHTPCGVVWEFLCVRTCSALVFLGGWSGGFIRVLETVQNHCSLCSWRHSYTRGHLWMALWFTATGTATCFVESSYHSPSKVSPLLSLVGMGGGRTQIFSTTVLLRLLFSL